MVQWRELGGGVLCHVTIATSTVLWHWRTGIAAGRECGHQGDLPTTTEGCCCGMKRAIVLNASSIVLNHTVMSHVTHNELLP